MTQARTAEETASPAGDRPGGAVAAMCLSLVLVVASVSAVNLALPHLAIDLHASNTALTWIADGYTVALAALVLPIGALGDRLGRRNVLIAGNLVFAGASLGASLAGSAGVLIAWRVAMGLGAAMIMPGTLSTITAALPPQRRARGVAIWSGFAAAGAIIGLLVAGALLERFTWHSIFTVSAITAVIAAAAALLLAPNTRDDEKGRPDPLGAALSAIAIGCLVFAIIEGNADGFTSPAVIAAIVVCVAGFAGYAVHGMRRDEPLLDPRLFGRRGFRAGTITVVVQFLAVFGFFFVGLRYLLLILGYSPLKAAVALVPVALLVIPVSLLTPRVLDRLGPRGVIPAGLLALAGGLLWISQLTTGSGYPPFLGGLLIAGAGLGLAGQAGTASIISSLSLRQQGVASAVNDTTREVGSAVGIALMGSVFTTRYTHTLPTSITALPAAVRAAVHQSPEAGLAAAVRLGGPQGAQLAATVKDSFMNGLSAALLAACAILAVAAIGTALRAPTAAQARAQAVKNSG
ncbi:MAG TPA: MFS transporter [Streptosporangiaceae bacterium]|jgi:EmrB/QacA subfamily drug resistance transporter|nr:MFS transporter [Streptosporangiaceae bacterium]